MSGDFPIRAVVAFWKPPVTRPLHYKKGPEIDLEKYCRKLSEWEKNIRTYCIFKISSHSAFLKSRESVKYLNYCKYLINIYSFL